ncbi:Carboxyvinyl-carboxyphosphonate phosphorylmutase [Nymphaea thermarum]|nr:Carboxyvinyl-carboxyphosphonate phosphorylmutase [Nymphaea thermarum]
MKKKRRRRPNSGFLGVQDSRWPLFIVDLMGEGESSALPFTGLVGEREGESGSAEGIVLMPGCYDALSTAIVQKSGFSAGFISGYALSASLLGKPDFGLLTQVFHSPSSSWFCYVSALSEMVLLLFIFVSRVYMVLLSSLRQPEMADKAPFICASAPNIPIIADADTGGGNALNMQRTVQDLIAAGAAGCFLEGFIDGVKPSTSTVEGLPLTQKPSASMHRLSEEALYGIAEGFNYLPFSSKGLLLVAFYLFTCTGFARSWVGDD